jgi:hypothetical protein
MNEPKVQCIEVRTPDGRVIIKVFVTEEPVPTSEPDRKPAEEQTKEKERSSVDNGELMTNAQKRFLFRILALKGVEGDQAYEELKKRFQVKTLGEVTKRDASTMIEKLLTQGIGAKANGSPLK